MRKSWLLGILPLLALACARHPASPSEVLDQAARESLGAAPSARALSLSGFHAYLVEGDAKKAQDRFDEALKKDPLDPYGLYGQHILAYRIAQPGRALEAALKVKEVSYAHAEGFGGAS